MAVWPIISGTKFSLLESENALFKICVLDCTASANIKNVTVIQSPSCGSLHNTLCLSHTVCNSMYLCTSAVLLQALPFYMDRSVLMCSDRNFLTNIDDPTTFCQIQGRYTLLIAMCIGMLFLAGFTTQLAIACFTGFWVFHVFHLFLSLMWPFKVKEMMESKILRRKVHFTEVMIVLLFGSVVPILTISLSEYQDSGLMCFPRPQNVLFYAGLIPILLAYIIGLSLLLGSFWILRRVSHVYYAV